MIPLVPFAASSISPFESFEELGVEIPPIMGVANNTGGQTGGGGVKQLLHSEAEQEEEGMRVLYEDPGQADERKKLMSLFKSQGQGQGQGQQGRGKEGTPPEVVRASEVITGRRGARTRRSARLEGF